MIKALSQILSPGMEGDRSLCPVRAIRFYMDRTKSVRKDQKKFFIAYTEPGHSKELCQGTISSWLKRTIILAYGLASTETCQVHRVKAHDVRGMAASWALHKKAPLEGIMRACHWKAHNTFTQFYL